MRSKKNIKQKKSVSLPHRSHRSRTGQTHLQVQKLQQVKPKVEWAIQRLTTSYVPEQIVGRAAQKLVIDDFVQNCLLNRVGCKVLYISGTPGVGKTASTMQILHKLQAKTKNKVKIGFINALALKKPNLVYKAMFDIISSDVIKQFQKKKMSFCMKVQEILPDVTKPHIMVIDEVDFLMTRDQSILYNLFDWVYHSTSKIGLIIIANTMDFPEQLSGKVNSRMGNNRLIFKPYNYQQIKQILQERLQGCTLFTSAAIMFTSKKLASHSSDIRTGLQVLHRAAQKHIQSQDMSLIAIQQIAKLWDQKVSLICKSNKGENCENLHTVILDYIKQHDNYCNSRPLLDILVQKGVQPANFYVLMKQLQEMDYIRFTQDRSGMFPSYNLRLVQRYKT